jgi:hypothetical protein
MDLSLDDLAERRCVRAARQALDLIQRGRLTDRIAKTRAARSGTQRIPE